MSTTEETLVRKALRDATDDLAAPVSWLAEASTYGGRRLRRRRRLLGAVGSVVAAVAIAVPAIAVLGVAGDRPSGVASDPAVDLPAPLPIGDRPGWWSQPSTDMLRQLIGITPAGFAYEHVALTNDDRAPGEPYGVMRGWLAADVSVGGVVVGGVNVVLTPPPLTGTLDNGCPGGIVTDDVASCSVLRDEAGQLIGHTLSTVDGDVRVLQVVAATTDGGQVYVAASNSADDKWGPGSTVASDTVPLTLEELTAIAIDDAWTDWDHK